MNSGYPVLYFDGVCNLCNRAVQFFIRNDRKGKFRFASLQSAAGIRAVNAAVEKGQKADSVLLYYKGRYYIKSSAVLKALHLLGGIWKLSAAVYIIPQVFRDYLYDRIAAGRYRWFGKRNECMLPAPELRSRFLQD